jgi:hypothetical protein
MPTVELRAAALIEVERLARMTLIVSASRGLIMLLPE